MRRALALRMGYPMRVLSRLMTYAEFLEWARVFSEEPFDDQRCFDRPAAAMQQTMTALHAPKAKLTVMDFLPFQPRESEAEGESVDVKLMRLL